MRRLWNITLRVDVASACVDRGQSPLTYLLTSAVLTYPQCSTVTNETEQQPCVWPSNVRTLQRPFSQLRRKRNRSAKIPFH